MSTPPFSRRFEFPTTVRAHQSDELHQDEPNESGLQSAPITEDESDSGPTTEHISTFARYECISEEESWIDNVFRNAYRDHSGAETAISSGAMQLPQIGTRFSGFDLLEELGHGAMSNVYLARQ